jgi:mRNA interferase RelE/StbE
LSSEYRIFETDQFQKDLRAIAKAGQAAVVRKLRNIVYPQLGRHPHFGPNIRKLRDYTPETWRYRIGAWRFFYEIDEQKKVVLMIAASHRSSAY